MTTSTNPARKTKSAIVTRLLRRAKGATIADITVATDWKPHSARAFLSTLRKKDHEIIREERKSGELAHRLNKSPCAK